MYHVNAQGVDKRMINVHYYYYCQSDEHRNHLKFIVRETSERRGGANVGFSERRDTILNWTQQPEIRKGGKVALK